MVYFNAIASKTSSYWTIQSSSRVKLEMHDDYVLSQSFCSWKLFMKLRTKCVLKYATDCTTSNLRFNFHNKSYSLTSCNHQIATLSSTFEPINLRQARNIILHIYRMIKHTVIGAVRPSKYYCSNLTTQTNLQILSIPTGLQNNMDEMTWELWNLKRLKENSLSRLFDTIVGRRFL